MDNILQDYDVGTIVVCKNLTKDRKTTTLGIISEKLHDRKASDLSNDGLLSGELINSIDAGDKPIDTILKVLVYDKDFMLNEVDIDSNIIYYGSKISEHTDLTISPYLFQFKEPIINNVTNDIYTINRVKWYGDMMSRAKRTPPELRGLNFELISDSPRSKITIQRKDLEKFYDLK